MKFKLDERGFVLAEFVIALPLLILLLYTLGIVTLNGLKIAREQAANYALETEAQYVIDRITEDARAAQSVKIESGSKYDKIIFICHANRKDGNSDEFYDVFTQRIYVVHSAQGKYFHIYFKRKEDDRYNNPITGDNTFGDHFVTQFKFDESKLPEKILHVTLEMESLVTQRKIKFSTSVFMPSYIHVE